jgi:mono/diheme cytochrome c family protein
MFFHLLFIAFSLCLVVSEAIAHPLQAEPLNHPYVFAFDQFNIADDPDEALVNGGLLLMAEANCAACHTPPAAWQPQLTPRPGPDLSGVGSRLDADTLWLMVRSPQHRRVGTLMPALFSAEDDAAPEKVEAITQYLLTLQQPVKPMPAGNAEHGKSLYHTVGCVACHQPATDYRPPLLPAGTEPEKPGNASNPIALADAYTLDALGRFLFDPLAYRPAGRMPSMHLSEAEAADIAAYLHVGRTAEKAVEREASHIPPQTASLGRKLFTEQRCTACHTTGEALPSPSATPMAKLQPISKASCIADEIAPGTPRYGFNPLQLRSLRLALSNLQQHAPEAMAPAEKIDWQMLRLNCYACHDRDGKGGPEDPRAAFFMAADSGAERLGDLGRYPPNLDNVGWKLTPQWLQRTLHGETRSQTRHYLAARMPAFGKANTAMLPEWFALADLPAPSPAPATQTPANPPDAGRGRQLMGTSGLGCVKCHGLLDHKSLDLPAINLSHTTERLQPSYFRALLLDPQKFLPGSLMPPVFSARSTADEDIESLWLYLKELKTQTLPDGMTERADRSLNSK